MKLNLRRLKLHPRETEEFALFTPGNDQYLDKIGGKFVAPIEGTLLVENTGTIFTGKGSLKTLIQLPCARCLQEFIYPVVTELDVVLVENNKNIAGNADEGFVLFDGDEANIDAEIQQAVFMALPICPLCKENCQGLCPVCGQDRNGQNCNCEEDKTDPRWDKLKSIKVGKEV